MRFLYLALFALLATSAIAGRDSDDRRSKSDNDDDEDRDFDRRGGRRGGDDDDDDDEDRYKYRKQVQFKVVYPKVVVNGSVFYRAHEANGELLTTNQTAFEPSVFLKNLNRKKLYTLITSDPDAPTPQNPIRADIVHWLAINIPGDKCQVSLGQALQPYRGPGPPSGSPPHRYIFRFYEQTFKLNASLPQTNLTSRFNFNTTAYAKANKLKLLASTYILAQRNC